MKCTAIKLSQRERIVRGRIWCEDEEPIFRTEEAHNYSFRYNHRKSVKPQSNSLTITNIRIPENFPSFNTGSSLEKWSKKRPRLKSAKPPISSNKSISDEDDRDFCYETLETDLSLLLNGVDQLSRSESLENLQYEVHTDIENLLLETYRNDADNLRISEKKLKPRKKRGKTKHEREKNKKKTKSIKFSISKPPSPQTEQVIRVDVTSNVSAVEDFHNVDDEEEKANEERAEMCDEDFIVRCRQLALKSQRKIVQN